MSGSELDNMTEVPWNCRTRGQRVAEGNHPVTAHLGETLFKYKWRQPPGTPNVIDDPRPPQERQLRVRAGIMAYGYTSDSLDVTARQLHTLTLIIDNGVYANHSFSRSVPGLQGTAFANELFNVTIDLAAAGFGKITELTTYQYNATRHCRRILSGELNINIKHPRGGEELFTEAEKRSVLPCHDVLAENCLWCRRCGHPSPDHTVRRGPSALDFSPIHDM